MENQIAKLRKQLQGFDAVVLVTQGEGKSGHARPMAVARVDENCNLWFFTGEHSAKVKETEADAHAQVIAQDGWTSCVIVAGRAAVVRDRVMIREMWKPAFKVWFPDGAEDPNIVLIHFNGGRAEYWDTGANRLTEWWVWDIPNHKVIAKKEFETRPTFKFSVGGDGKRLYLYGAGSTLEIFDAATLESRKLIYLNKDTTTNLVTLAKR